MIASRTDSLSRFTGASARLARLPAPKLAPVVLKPLIQRVTAFDTRVPVVVKPGPDVTIDADADQLEQLLINLLRNAADACLEVGGGTVTVAGGGRKAGSRHRRRGRGPWPGEHVEPVRAVLHHQAGRVGHRAGACAGRSPKATAAR